VFFQVKVRVRVDTLRSFGEQLMQGKLDRSAIVSDTYCEKDDPAVGVSYWQAESREVFEQKFAGWRPFYASVEIREVVTAKEAMGLLFAQG
jgi:hypothetical protein